MGKKIMAKTMDEAISMIRKNPMNIHRVPHEMKTKEICDLVFGLDSRAIQYFPYEFITPERCEIAIRDCGFTLGDLPKTLITSDLCELATKSEYWSIRDIPVQFRTQEICVLHILRSLKNRRPEAATVRAEAIRHVPEALRDAVVAEGQKRFDDLIQADAETAAVEQVMRLEAEQRTSREAVKPSSRTAIDLKFSGSARSNITVMGCDPEIGEAVAARIMQMMGGAVVRA